MMSQIIGIALGVFALVFIISAIWWWVFKKFGFVKIVLDYSTIIMLTLIILLIVSLLIEGSLFDKQNVPYF